MKAPDTGKSCRAELEMRRQGFLESLRVRGRSPATVASRGDSLRCFFAWLERLGIADVRAVTHGMVGAYLRWLEAEGYSEHTRHTRLIALRRLFEWLLKTDAMLINPCAGHALAKLPRRLPSSVLTEAQARKILAQPDKRKAKGARDYALLELFYATGLRGGEMTRLRLEDVDIKNALVRVVRGKGGKDRLVPMGKKAAAALAVYVQGARERWSRAGSERALWLGCVKPHGALTLQAIAVTVRDYARAAGICVPYGRTHVWRHTCATHLVARGANIAYVQRLLGHVSLETTQIYTRVAALDLARMHRKKHPRQRIRFSQPAQPPFGENADESP